MSSPRNITSPDRERVNIPSPPAAALIPVRPRSVGLAAIPWLACPALLGACATPSKDVYREETFEVDSPFAHHFGIGPSDTCEAARRTLLSQGYIVSAVQPERVTAAKAFQPNLEEHTTIEFTVSCVSADGGQATAYANAVQTRYQLRTSPNSYGLSAPVIGALSLPFGSKAENLVKTGAATITDGEFYSRFWSLMAMHVTPVAEDPRH